MILVLTKGQQDKAQRLAWIDEGLKLTQFAAEKFPNEAASNAVRKCLYFL